MALSVSLPFLKGSIFMPIGIYKGQLISKQNCGAVTSSKKRTKEFCPGRLLLQG